MTTANTGFNNVRVAYLLAYLPDGSVMEYRTGKYEEVYKFKKVCQEKGIDHAVRFRKVETNDEAYIRKGARNTILGVYKRVRRFLYSRLF